MNARSLLVMFDTIYLVAMAAWLGSVSFFVFGIAPVLAKLSEAGSGVRLARAVLPKFYAWGATSGAVALAAFVSGPLCVPEYRGLWVAAQAPLLLAGTLLMLYGGNSLTPALIAAEGEGPAGRDSFARLFRRGLWLNGVVVVLGIGLLAAFASRPAPKTSGIVELSPIERVRQDEEHARRVREGLIQKAGKEAPNLQPRGSSNR